MKPLLPLIAASSILTATVPLYADTFGTGANQFTMDFVEIGNAGNAGETYVDYRESSVTHGAVNYNYRMGTHEVSRGMIDSYNANSGGPALTMFDMAPHGGNGENRPATGVNWNEAARFVNWLNTNKGYAAAYKFTTGGADDNITPWTVGNVGYDSSNPYRNSNAHYFLPSENEWYKAAYFAPDENAGTGGYWDYATGSDTSPSSIVSGMAPGTAVYGHSTSLGPADINNAGGSSPYGTVAQSGNVYEWIESAFDEANVFSNAQRTVRGGSWFSGSAYISYSFRNGVDATHESTGIGFRVASRVNPPPRTTGIDSGGGKASLGTQTNHSSIGGGFATSSVDAGAVTIRSGLIEVLYAGTVPYDGDKNGLPDAWEREHFGYIGVDPLGDDDGDADTNLMEFLAGTDPRDVKSHFKPPGTHDGAFHTIPIQTIVDRKYEVFVSRDMENWYLQETYTGDGTQKVFNFDETTMPAGPLHSETHPSAYFFRVKITEL